MLYDDILAVLKDFKEDIDDVDLKVMNLLEEYDILTSVEKICYEDKHFSMIIFSVYYLEIISKIVTDALDKKDISSINFDYKDLVEDIHKELTFTSEDDITYTDEELIDLIKKCGIDDIELSSGGFAKFRFIVHYINYYGISKDLREREDDKEKILIKVIKIVVAYLTLVDILFEEYLKSINDNMTDKERLYWKMIILVKARTVLGKSNKEDFINI